MIFSKDLSDLQTLKSLALKINKTREDTLNWLNKVYKFLVDQNMLNEFDNYAIIPNQRGDFKLLKELYSDHTSRISFHSKRHLQFCKPRQFYCSTRADGRRC